MIELVLLGLIGVGVGLLLVGWRAHRRARAAAEDERLRQLLESASRVSGMRAGIRRSVARGYYARPLSREARTRSDDWTPYEVAASMPAPEPPSHPHPQVTSTTFAPSAFGGGHSGGAGGGHTYDAPSHDSSDTSSDSGSSDGGSDGGSTD
jgi:hypothetical protein